MEPESAASQERRHGESFSVVIPVKDEGWTIGPLVDQIVKVARTHALGLVDIVVVDDGSIDHTWAELEKLSAQIPVLHAIRLRRNFGKSAALNVGIKAARGDIVITMDGDLQDDPLEIPAFLKAIAEGDDLVSGWKKDRQDPLSKTLPSALFNRITAKITGIPLHDFNCGLKAYRREVLSAIGIYGELHRYIPVLENALGYRIGEITVRHHARRHGRSKYGATRLLKGFIDLLTVLAITRFAHRPGHLFGGMGVVVAVLGVGIALLLLVLRLIFGVDPGTIGIIVLIAIFAVSGLMVIMLGILAELLILRDEKAASPAVLIAAEIPPRADAM